MASKMPKTAHTKHKTHQNASKCWQLCCFVRPSLRWSLRPLRVLLLNGMSFSLLFNPFACVLDSFSLQFWEVTANHHFLPATSISHLCLKLISKAMRFTMWRIFAKETQFFRRVVKLTCWQMRLWRMLPRQWKWLEAWRWSQSLSPEIDALLG